ncbi:hypothetical protein FRX31_021751 [Thalictrum thalictroides]|uniref:Uncharacterized protein n=1 Tax=Thalictrum thalictroides TaxID=46969 RepID=A0A7J6VWG1_THATH|nr:hypothetical protein FRX31_021751 [Thalictrum thalictroides]
MNKEGESSNNHEKKKVLEEKKGDETSPIAVVDEVFEDVINDEYEAEKKNGGRRKKWCKFPYTCTMPKWERKHLLESILMTCGISSFNLKLCYEENDQFTQNNHVYRSLNDYWSSRIRKVKHLPKEFNTRRYILKIKA